MPDDVMVGHGGVSGRDGMERLIFELRPGLSEVSFRPASDLPELRAFAPDWSQRVEDLELLTIDTHVSTLLDRAGAVLVGYGELRDAMRGDG